jgi:hypothetical protein
MIWHLDELIESSKDCQTERNGKWVAARPINWKHRSLKQRLVEAFAVFIGTTESFYWPEGQ